MKSTTPTYTPPSYNNGTATGTPTFQTSVGTITPPANPPVNTPGNPPAPTDVSPPIVTAGAGRTAVLSGGALAGLLGVAAFVL